MTLSSRFPCFLWCKLWKSVLVQLQSDFFFLVRGLNFELIICWFFASCVTIVASDIISFLKFYCLELVWLSDGSLFLFYKWLTEWKIVRTENFNYPHIKMNSLYSLKYCLVQIIFLWSTKISLVVKVTHGYCFLFCFLVYVSLCFQKLHVSCLIDISIYILLFLRFLQKSSFL